MTEHAEKLLREVLRLPPEERLALVERVQESFETDEASIEASWDEVARHRLARLRAGKATLIPWETVREMLKP